ncbi:hypothetical protein PR202_ga26296 [Eleusine coracana subsp. coracana]|uniref:Secreted protein n=1 Tax=Eleusine coracana subsp. coracana TaxID=191504 RepID=A0AAV5DDS0_ELECO|nr:hypothetical protein PR202_ga26290 [Eleusine coracana subsp. coracana]GJN08385.1 hypothetical protein PR202_ga26296 [Eleusine coracana subsp. coracana]
MSCSIWNAVSTSPVWWLWRWWEAEEACLAAAAGPRGWDPSSSACSASVKCAARRSMLEEDDAAAAVPVTISLSRTNITRASSRLLCGPESASAAAMSRWSRRRPFSGHSSPSPACEASASCTGVPGLVVVVLLGPEALLE